ncbi:condensin-2 complex subunit H2 [Manihot esculenta]|uniref:condensin-2 complex subunit H2 n=1 Tax=Manihot esculenta TaxID=3983 RepID=UPI001CC5847D|nr:condensin-2 complex subunit H2 [Manihot esculenta]
MPKPTEQPPNNIHTLRAERDLGANLEVDLASKLEDYLLKIYSGEITAATASLNLAEVASLLQGSVQVYSRKVQYLYNLVLHALESLSHFFMIKQEQSEGTLVQAEQSGFLMKKMINFDTAVEANNSLDDSTSKDASFYSFVKPPANLVVLEGDCLDASGDGGELESYLLATNDFYRDFIPLDPCDSVAVDDFLKGDETGKVPNSSGRTALKSSLGKNLDENFNQPPMTDCSVGVNNCNVEPDLPTYGNYEDGNHGFDMDDGSGNLEDLEDDDNDGARGICNLNLDR